MVVRRLILCSIPICVAATGCVTPQPVKDASTTQLQLISSLDAASLALEKGLNQYNSEKHDLILQEGQILVARAAIDEALPNDSDKKKLVSFDEVYALSNKAIRPSIDTPLGPDNIQQAIEGLTKRIAAIPSTTRSVPATNVLKSDLQDLTVRKAATRPKSVESLSSVVDSDLTNISSTDASIKNLIEGLRDEIAVMKVMATDVDKWLGIDVTLTADQVSSLDQTYSSLISKTQGTAATSTSGK